MEPELAIREVVKFLLNLLLSFYSVARKIITSGFSNYPLLFREQSLVQQLPRLAEYNDGHGIKTIHHYRN